jgi:hypothetical protein
MDDMLKDFVVEALDLATNVEEHLLRLERDPREQGNAERGVPLLPHHQGWGGLHEPAVRW